MEEIPAQYWKFNPIPRFIYNSMGYTSDDHWEDFKTVYVDYILEKTSGKTSDNDKTRNILTHFKIMGVDFKREKDFIELLSTLSREASGKSSRSL
jgi:hypothetical protein